VQCSAVQCSAVQCSAVQCCCRACYLEGKVLVGDDCKLLGPVGLLMVMGQHSSSNIGNAQCDVHIPTLL
jgi:hypothetical protein